MSGNPQLARGGLISGPGSGTTDTVPVLISPCESRVSIKFARKYGLLLDAINNGLRVCRWLSHWDDAVMPCHDRTVPGAPFCAEHLIENERTKP